MKQSGGQAAVRLRTRELTLAYGDRTVSSGLTVDVPDRALTAVVGANACGKSTLLRSLVRLLDPVSGAAEFDGRDVRAYRSKAMARDVAFLPQGLVAPASIRVRQLVAKGRYPHQSVLAAWSPDDRHAVDAAMEAAGIADLAERPVEALSGGQRQRAWVAMVLAQQTPYLLLDEPTTFLDIAHQYQLLRLLSALRDEGRTIVTVLHDINQACRFADHLIAMRDGQVVAEGAPAGVVDAALIGKVFDLDCVVVPDPVAGTPMIVPRV